MRDDRIFVALKMFRGNLLNVLSNRSSALLDIFLFVSFQPSLQDSARPTCLKPFSQRIIVVNWSLCILFFFSRALTASNAMTFNSSYPQPKPNDLRTFIKFAALAFLSVWLSRSTIWLESHLLTYIQILHLFCLMYCLHWL